MTEHVLTVLVWWIALGFIACAIYGIANGGRK